MHAALSYAPDQLLTRRKPVWTGFCAVDPSKFETARARLVIPRRIGAYGPISVSIVRSPAFGAPCHVGDAGAPFIGDVGSWTVSAGREATAPSGSVGRTSGNRGSGGSENFRSCAVVRTRSVACASQEHLSKTG